MTEQWIVNPNRMEPGPNKPGRNGHFRSDPDSPRPAAPEEVCQVRIVLPKTWTQVPADPDGSVTFGGSHWSLVVGAARAFARDYVDDDVLPPFGYFDAGAWWWWDGTTSEESILEGPDAADYVREYLQLLYPGAELIITESL
ncbi:Uncharacterised protein [Mycobacteroides abscessus subsp. bolletii]|uniref:hypothetical protein n=1 Tax=Mycobacteroides abscessus TaxID=36809 RepID=UPI0009A67CC4|nr:hypothetical protein [Mycobacteroides abscessus]SKU94044.1 Uncharacterised protein [Mycobacteroides abscessus subsp. bolletii]